MAPMTWLTLNPSVKSRLSAPRPCGGRGSSHITMWPRHQLQLLSVRGKLTNESFTEMCLIWAWKSQISLCVSGLSYVKLGNSELSRLLWGGPWQGRRPPVKVRGTEEESRLTSDERQGHPNPRPCPYLLCSLGSLLYFGFMKKFGILIAVDAV